MSAFPVIHTPAECTDDGRMVTGFAQCPSRDGGSCSFPANPLVSVPDAKFGDMQIFRCEHCGHGITTPYLPDVSVLYHGRETQDYQPRDNAIATAIKLFAFRRQVGTMLQQAGFAGGRILDFGCGSGLYTAAIAACAKESGEVTGLDFFPEPPSQIGSADYLPFARSSQLYHSADLVTCFHVLEHDPEPQKILDQLVALAKPGATVVIEVPHIDCPWRHVFGRYWDNWYLPFHRTHFSRSSLRAAVRQSGLSILDEHAVHIPAIGRSLANVLGVRNNLAMVLVSALGHPVQMLGERVLDGPSALRIIARAPSN